MAVDVNIGLTWRNFEENFPSDPAEQRQFVLQVLAPVLLEQCQVVYEKTTTGNGARPAPAPDLTKRGVSIGISIGF